MRLALVLALAALLAPLRALASPAVVRPLITVAVEHGDSATALASSYDPWIRAAVEDLDRGDPVHRWQYVADATRADRVVHHVPDDDALPARVAGYEHGDDVFLAPSRLPGGLAIESATVHALEHTVGTGHVCAFPGELPDADHPREACSPVGYGDAIANPQTHYPVAHPRCDPFEHVCVGAVARTALTDLDRAELERAARRRGR